MLKSHDNSADSDGQMPRILTAETVSVAVAVPVAGAYDYLQPKGALKQNAKGETGTGISRGTIVSVPFGGRIVAGIVLGAGAGDVAPEKLKAINAVAALPALSEAFVSFIERVAAWTLAPIGAVAKMVLSQPRALQTPPQTKLFTKAKIMPDGIRITPARQQVLDVLGEAGAMSAAELAGIANVGTGVITAMAKADMLDSMQVSADRPPPPPQTDRPGLTLTNEQQDAADIMVAACGKGFHPFLLDGVTGSGKTEVYFEAVKATLEAGQQVLILLPEIALSSGWRTRFERRFGVAPVEWHSDIGNSQKRRAWRYVLSGEAKLVVGARSALFLPFSNLGLIVVDEEHDHAYKQEDQTIYQARDMAVVRAHIQSCPIILASATPSLESWVNAGKTGETPRYQHIGLPNRIKGAALPAMTAIDLRQTPPEKGRWLAPPLVVAIANRLAAGEQSLLFLNRRGYAPLTLCGSCGHKLVCPNCDSWMVAHKLSGRLRCHHCGHQTRPSNHCSACGQEDTMQACGPGVERLAEEVLWRFPEARFAVLSSDTVGTPKAAAAFIQSVIDGDVDIIIGTQMVAKGHHFPNLTLVGVVDADLGLAGGDLRAAERTFQMLSQVAGRAGRESRPGEAMLQTLDPENQVLACLLEGKRDNFLSMEAHARSLAGMPPSGQLAALILSSHDEKRLHATLRRLDQSRPHFTGVDIFGPAIAPIGFLKGRHRGRMLIRTDRSVDIQGILRNWLADFKPDSGVKLQIDIDPYNFL
ncbi:MAG: primosomal protein N' [Candidatus Puniceispirillum sp.]